MLKHLLCVFSLSVFLQNAVGAENFQSKTARFGGFTHKNATPQTPSKPFLELKTVWGLGFFGEFLIVIGALYLYEAGQFAGVDVEFDSSGTFYEENKGPNWWNYYFEPITVGSKNNAYTLQTCNASELNLDLPRYTEFHIPRLTANRLINKYIHVKPHIQAKVDKIVKENFSKGKTIAVHYRGTDKYLEDPLAPFDLVARHVNEAIAKLSSKNPSQEIKIFVATDQQSFLNYMLAMYPSAVVYYKEGIRSTDDKAVHTSTLSDPYKLGEDALIDCLLLSRCDYLIKTSSNLSLCAAYFNPHIPMIHATSRYWHAPLE